LHTYHWGHEDGRNPDIPVLEGFDFGSWTERDDIEHVSGPYDDNTYSVTEIRLHSDAEIRNNEILWKDGIDHDDDHPSILSSGDWGMYEEIDDGNHYEYDLYDYIREACADTHEPLEEEIDSYIPVLTVHSGEKGCFGMLLVVTDDDFDPCKLAIGAVETNLGTIIESYCYDGVPLEINWDEYDTTGKGYYAEVAWMNKGMLKC